MAGRRALGSIDAIERNPIGSDNEIAAGSGVDVTIREKGLTFFAVAPRGLPVASTTKTKGFSAGPVDWMDANKQTYPVPN